jgi:hypothetical protein
MIKIHKNILNATQIARLKKFLYKKDSFVDDRGSVYNKLVRLKDKGWPKTFVLSILKQTLPNHSIENVDFVRMSYQSVLHCDTDKGDQKTLGKNIIIPLTIPKDGASTAVFDHKWYGSASRFTKDHHSPFKVEIKTSEGQSVLVKDIRRLYKKMLNTKDKMVVFKGYTFYNNQTKLKKIIKKRLSAQPRVSNYKGMTDLTNKPFDETFRKKWLFHISAKTLFGLQKPTICKWQIGDIITFDRQHVHSGTSQSKEYKEFVAIFTRKNDR